MKETRLEFCLYTVDTGGRELKAVVAVNPLFGQELKAVVAIPYLL